MDTDHVSSPPMASSWIDGSKQTHRVARAIVRYGPIARTTLAQLLNLSQGALSRITSDLLYAGIIEELPAEVLPGGKLPRNFKPKPNEEKRGRPQTALRIRSQERSIIGVNIHDTDVSVQATDALCQPLTPCFTESLDSTRPSEVVTQITHLVERCSEGLERKPSALGLSLGGHTQDNRFVTYAPFLHWEGRIDLGKMLEESCGVQVTVFNDLDSVLLYESWFGRGVGIPRFAVLTIGVGVGYALCENGKPVDYPDKSYGLVGHIPIDPEGPRCYAGHIGCSQCLTDDSLAEEYSTLIKRTTTFEQFAEDARNGKAQARQLVNRLCFRLGVLVSNTANFAMPETVFISGESSFLARLNTESIRSGINWYRPSQASKVHFEILDFSWQSWSLGAAAQAIAHNIG